MVELRKRKAPAEPAPPPATKKASNPVKKAVTKAKEAVAGKKAEPAAKGNDKIAVDQVLSLDGFGGEIETHEGTKTTLKKLLDESKAGVVLFTYPKASTPGCTTQVCLFRDNITPLTEAGLSVFGLSSDSPKSNTTFVTKQSLPYPLICDPSRTLISAIGMKKAPAGTSRGVVVIDKSGKVTAWEQGGPQRTVDVVMASLPAAGGAKNEPLHGVAKKEAETAAEVADTAEKIDSHVELGPPTTAA